jgi:hypothetical protein
VVRPGRRRLIVAGVIVSVIGASRIVKFMTVLGHRDPLIWAGSR